MIKFKQTLMKTLELNSKFSSSCKNTWSQKNGLNMESCFFFVFTKHGFIVRWWLGVNSITRAFFALVCIFSALLFNSGNMYSADIWRTFCAIIKVFLYGHKKLIKCFHCRKILGLVGPGTGQWIGPMTQERDLGPYNPEGKRWRWIFYHNDLRMQREA